MLTGCIPFNNPPEPSGKNNIGTQSMELVDSNRLEWFTDSKDDLRRIMIQVWYPTQDEEGEKVFTITNDHFEKAFFLATSGRPGPVWIDIPLDVQKFEIDPKKLRGFKISTVVDSCFSSILSRCPFKSNIRESKSLSFSSVFFTLEDSLFNSSTFS